MLRSLAGLTVLVASTFAAQAPAPAVQPAVHVSPSGEILLGTPARVRLTGLSPGTSSTLVAELIDDSSRRLRSWATFAVPESGIVDLGSAAPLSGTYEGVDPSGLFWSMAAGGAESAPPPWETPLEELQKQATPVASDVHLTLLLAGRPVARLRHRRLLQGPEVVAEDVRDDGLVAVYRRLPGRPKRPGILLVGGSGGGIGWQRLRAGLLASRGYPSLGLAYFGMDGVPDTLDKIPLEYVGKALAWMRRRPEIDPSRIVVCGISKGAELALLAGSQYPDVRAVVAFVPSSVVFQSINPRAGWPRTSSWTKDGEQLPFVPYDPASMGPQVALVDLYRNSLDKQPDAVAAAAIPVERIRGPVLLFSGRADSIWPSTRMAGEVAARLRRQGHPHRVEHVAYDDADHGVSGPGQVPVRERLLGGTRRGLARAQEDSWTRLLEFLETELGPGEPKTGR